MSYYRSSPRKFKLEPIKPGVPVETYFKVRDTKTGFFWTGSSNHSKFYDSVGASWKSYEDATKALGGLVAFQGAEIGGYAIKRIKARCDEMDNWEIVEGRVAIELLSDTAKDIDTTNVRVLLAVYSRNKTVGECLSRSLKDTDKLPVMMMHLKDYSKNVFDVLTATGIPSTAYYRHRTVLEIRDRKWALVAKLAVGGTREVLDIEEIKNEVLSKSHS